MSYSSAAAAVCGLSLNITAVPLSLPAFLSCSAFKILAAVIWRRLTFSGVLSQPSVVPVKLSLFETIVACVTYVTESASSCCWFAWSSSAALILFTPDAGSGILSSYRQVAFISSCCIHPQEHPPDIQSSSSLTDFCHQLKTLPVPTKDITCSSNHAQTICCNYPHVDFASVDFVYCTCHSSHV